MQTPGTFDPVYFSVLNFTNRLDFANADSFANFDSALLGTKVTGVDVCLAKDIPAQ